MAKQTSTPETPSSSDTASTPQNLESTTPQPQALEVAAPIISSELYGTITTEAMKKDSYLIVDSRMDASDITVTFRIEEEPEIKFAPIVDSSGASGPRRIPIPLEYLTRSMRFTLVVSYEGTAGGKPAVSLAKYVTVNFYPAEQSKALAPKLRDQKNVQNTPTYDMHDHIGDEKVDIPIPYLAQPGDKIYCSVVTTQFDKKPASYLVVYGHALTLEDIKSGTLEFSIPRGWLARQRPSREAITCHAGWITSGLLPQPPKDTENPDEKTFLPANALDIQYRHTAQFIGDQGLENLPPPHLLQSGFFEGKWHLNPQLTTNGGDVDTPTLDTYAGDRICFYVNGLGYESKLLGCVDIQNDGDLASVKLPRGVIACFFNKSMQLNYTVQFPNLVGAEPRSPNQDVEVGKPRLSPSEIAEATHGKLNLNIFSGDATAFVYIGDYATCSAFCWMWIEGENDLGDKYRFDILTKEPVTEDWKSKYVETSIPRHKLQPLADCSDFTLHFAVTFCEASDRSEAIEAPAATFHIVQEDLVLPAPKVDKAENDELEPWNAQANGVVVVVSYPRMSDRQSIKLCWKDDEDNYWPLDPQAGDIAGSVTFRLPLSAVIFSIGTSVEISYTVTTGCGIKTSERLLLKILVPHRLTPPVVRQATPVATQDGVLNLSTFAGNADIDVEKWWFILLQQKGRMRAEGTRQNGSLYTFDVYLKKPVTDTNAKFSDIVSRSDLAVLKNNTSLTFTFFVRPNPRSDQGYEVMFPSLRLLFLSAFRDFTPFAGGNRNGWLDGAASQGENRYAVYFGKPSIANGTAYSGSAGVILYKNVTGLVVGRSYRFSMLGCTYNGAAPLPHLSLGTDAGPVTAATIFTAMAWRKIEGTFIASSSSMQLRVLSHLSSGASGNDFAMTDLLLEDF